MDPEELAAVVDRLRHLGSDYATVEAKACRQELGKDVWESISAFANTEGGWLLLGIDENAGFSPTFGFQPQKVIDQLVDGMGKGNITGAKLTNPPDFDVYRQEVDGHPVVVVRVAQAPPACKPCYITARGIAGGSYRRIDDKDIRLTPTEIFAFQHLLIQTRADWQEVPESSQEDLDLQLIEKLFAAHRATRPLRGVADPQARLRRLNILGSSNQLRLAGALTVSSYPQQFFPQLFIDVAVHPGVEKSAPDATFRFLDRVQCEGPLADAVDEAVAAVARNLRTTSVIVGTGRREELEIPREVLREAISNAVLHRAYDPLFQGQAVSVDVFPDRVVVGNPGGLWGGRTVENIGNGQSDCRNSFLLQILKAIPLSTEEGTVVEGNGSGVPFMVNSMRSRALAEPVFRATPDRVEVTFARHGAAIPKVRAWAVEAARRPLEPDEEAVVLALRQRGEMEVRALHQFLKMDSDDVRSRLRTLAQDGVVETCGPETYRLTRPFSLRAGRVHEVVLDALSESQPLSVHELAEITGKTPNALRPILRRLVADGSVEATAPAQSRYRKYLRVP